MSMKTKSNLFIASAILLALVAGFLIGISVEYPKINSDELSGTVGKVNNYRNAKASEEDIRLKDQIVADTVMAREIKKYIELQYVKAVQLSAVLSQASDEIEKEKNFKAKNPELLSIVGKYKEFVETSKPNFLLVVAAFSNAKEVNPVLLRHSFIRAKEIIAQMNYGNKSILSLISKLEDYITKERSADKQIMLAHDLLVRNQVGNALMFQDKLLMKYFEKKKMFGSDFPVTSNTNLDESIRKDMESLKGIEIEDFEQLGAAFYDQEKLGFDNIESLSAGYTEASTLGVMDIEHLGIFDFEKLGAVLSNESLGIIYDMENLGIIYL